MKPFWTLMAGLALAAQAQGALKTQTMEYKQGDTVLKGYLAYDDAATEKRPGVLVVPEWWGLNDFPRGRAEELAKLGYVAFAADIYGNGKTTSDPREAGQLAGALKKDRALLRARVNAGLEALRRQPPVDPARLAAIGFCFGGTAVLELARSGADVAGVVCFHGNLDTPNPDDARKIKAKVLALLGGDDPNVPMTEVAAFANEMRQANVDWQVTLYGGAVHSFTNPAAGLDPKRGAAYNEDADVRSGLALRAFLAERFPKR